MNKVLLIEDTPVFVLLVENFLRDSFELCVAFSLKDGLLKLKEKKPDVILLDLFLPDSSGLETFRTIRAEDPTIPVIILTGAENIETARKLIQEGAQDYILKKFFSEDRLISSLEFAIIRNQLKIEFEANFKKLVEKKR